MSNGVSLPTRVKQKEVNRTEEIGEAVFLLSTGFLGSSRWWWLNSYFFVINQFLNALNSISLCRLLKVLKKIFRKESHFFHSSENEKRLRIGRREVKYAKPYLELFVHTFPLIKIKSLKVQLFVLSIICLLGRKFYSSKSEPELQRTGQIEAVFSINSVF